MRPLDRPGTSGQFPQATAPEARRLELEHRQDAMTNGFVLATDPTLPPAGLDRAVYAIGNFDGLHLGHQAVIEQTRRLAEARGAPSALLTFEPHPADFFAERPVAFRLTTPELKIRLAEQLGLDGLVFMSF